MMKKPLEYWQALHRVKESERFTMEFARQPGTSMSHEPWDIWPTEAKAASLMSKTQCECLLEFLIENEIVYAQQKNHSGEKLFVVPEEMRKKYNKNGMFLTRGQIYNEFMTQNNQAYYWGSTNANKNWGENKGEN